MTMRFAVLASGSAGNCSVVQTEEMALLIDAGLGPRQLEVRLSAAGVGWSHLQAVLLTHTHGDHWHERTLVRLGQRGIPLYCHPHHQRNLHVLSPAFADLAQRGLVRDYEPGAGFELSPRLSCLPFLLQHDSIMTCGFRIEARPGLFGRPAVLAYAADLGCWDRALAELLADAEVLALEFNHDVALQRASRRSRRTIARNLGNRGHLSNEQAAALVKEVLHLSEPDGLRHVVQLHLSQECNRPALAIGALQAVLAALGAGIQIHTASQDEIGPHLTMGESGGLPATNGKRRSRRRKVGACAEPMFIQPLLPGWEEG